jgi:hypothetical protein
MFEMRLADARNRAERLPKRPKVFFEEWDDPLISGIVDIGARRDRRWRRHLRRSRASAAPKGWVSNGRPPKAQSLRDFPLPKKTKRATLGSNLTPESGEQPMTQGGFL